jgi:peptide deformylase
MLHYLTAMAKLPIIKLPDPLLRTVSKPVERVDDGVRAFLDDLLETMYVAPGIGLAAVQVGRPIRALVMDVSARESKAKGGALVAKRPICMINPVIVKRGDVLVAYEEGCLSIPEIYAEVERPDSVTVRYIDRDGKQQEMQCDDVLATCVQHEIDHLDGKLFIDYLGRLKRGMIIRKFVKARRAEQTA